MKIKNLKKLRHPASSEVTDILARRVSKANQLDSGSHKRFVKRGAMFGLDARIALAIFGALSVISGASLYSAIKEARVTATIVELEEMAKAVVAYHLDTGSFVPRDSSTPSLLKVGEVVQSSERGWGGPYLPYEWVSDTNISSSGFGPIWMKLWLSDFSASCTDLKDSDCKVWIQINKNAVSGGEKLMNDVELKVDGAIDSLSGYVTRSGPFYFYRIDVK